MTQIEEINQIAKTLEIPEDQMSAFRIGYYQGGADALEENKKRIDQVLNASFNNPSQNALDAFMNSGHSTKATDQDMRMAVEDELGREDTINI